MFPRRRGVFRCMYLLVAAGLCGCGTPRVVGAALKGSLADLGVEMRTARTRGEFDADTTRELAVAVAQRVVASAHDPDGPSLLLTIGTCRHELVEAYQQRAQGTDATAAAATVALLEDGLLAPEELVRTYRSSTDATWLAVAARAATSAELAAWRNTLIRHPDARVRRAALRACIVARGPENEEELLAASRVDPDPECRRLALIGLASLGTERSMAALLDRWRTGTSALQLAVVEAWATRPAYSSGGRDALERAASGSGRPAVAAAAALLRAPQTAPGWLKDVLARMLENGTETERLAAISVSDPQHARTAEALTRLSHEASPVVRLAALNALLRNPAHAAQARSLLLESAMKDDRLSRTASGYLARAGERSIVQKLERQLESRVAQDRVSAALALTALGLPQSAVSALVEQSPKDRLTVACAMITAPEGR